MQDNLRISKRNRDVFRLSIKSKLKLYFWFVYIKYYLVDTFFWGFREGKFRLYAYCPRKTFNETVYSLSFVIKGLCKLVTQSALSCQLHARKVPRPPGTYEMLLVKQYLTKKVTAQQRCFLTLLNLLVLSWFYFLEK